jgi:parallel beta-helix repeat protein
MRYLTIIAIFCIVVFGGIIIVSLTAGADTITVGPGGAPTYDFEYITNAISNANENDTIEVYGGVYNENIDIDKALMMTGVAGSGSTTIISRRSNDNTIDITASYVNISGFSIKNLGGSYACISFDTVSNCKITDNLIKKGGNGLYLIRSNSITIKDNTIENNNIGIYFSDSDTSIIQRNYIQNNNANGIFLVSTSTGNTIYHNHFSNNLDGNARDIGTNNWDYNSEGNYWDDYNDYDNNGDGIGDNPYIIGVLGNQDNFPLGDFLSSGDKPVAYIDSISPNPSGLGETITFSGHGSDDGSVVAWVWKSGGTTIGSSATFSISSLSSGTHTISFRVQDNDGKWSEYDYATLVIDPNQKPIAHISKPETDATYLYGEIIEFNGYGIDPDGEIVGYIWRSEPVGISSVEDTFNNSELPVGKYTIFFKVKDDYSDWSEETNITIEILSDPDNQEPIADAGGPYNGFINKDITFDGSNSNDPDEGDTINYTWDFGDGSTGEGAFPTHKYTSEGNYTIELTVIDSYGEQAISTTYIVIAKKTNDQNGDKGIPGFITSIVIIAIAFILVLKYKKRK